MGFWHIYLSKVGCSIIFRAYSSILRFNIFKNRICSAVEQSCPVIIRGCSVMEQTCSVILVNCSAMEQGCSVTFRDCSIMEQSCSSILGSCSMVEQSIFFIQGCCSVVYFTSKLSEQLRVSSKLLSVYKF